jgi:hypothetical protein
MKRAPETFVAMVEEDPLFAAEGMDIERGVIALDAIERCTREIEEASAGGHFAARLFFIRYPLARYALPLPFVRNIIESERVRRQFVANPSRENAEHLLAQWNTTQSEFAASVARYRALHHIARYLDRDGGSLSPVTDMHGNITVPADVERTLGLLAANARRLGDEVREREAFLRGEHVSRSRIARRKELPTFESGEMPAAYKHLHALELAHSLPFRDGTILEKHGPFSHVLPWFDGKPTRHQFMLYLVRNNEIGTVSLKLSALDVHLFLKLGKDERLPGLGRLHETLVERGIPYWYQPSTNLYTMRDQTYWVDIAVAVDLVRRPELPVRNVSMQRSSMFDALLGACLEDHRMYLSNAKEIQRLSGRMPRRWYSLLYRTHSSIYYMPFNASVWRLNEEPHFLGSGRERPKDALYVSADTVLKNTTPEEFELIMRGGRIREEARRQAVGL